jgi:hypothetical protein
VSRGRLCGSGPRPFPTLRRSTAAAAIIVCSLFHVACGKKGPPLPPLVKLPTAPSDLTASRRADTVEVQFIVPSSNTDNTRPANVVRVDVYAFTGPQTVSEAEVLAQGTRIASVPVKAPRDPDVTFDPGDPDQSEADVEPPEGDGLDQGAVARIREALPPRSAPATGADAPQVRSYVGVAVTTRGRPGPLSSRAAVPLVPPPPVPAPPTATYTEKEVIVTWAPGRDASPEVLYQVYEVSPSTESPLTKAPIAETRFSDSRMTWGARRCYGVRSSQTVAALTVESDVSEPVCVTLSDTFPPAPPGGLQAVASEGVINLIWNANAEPDLDGYVLLRAQAPAGELIPVTTVPIRETAFQDMVPSGIRYVYALQAVDTSGNRSAISATTEETAR